MKAAHLFPHAILALLATGFACAAEPPTESSQRSHRYDIDGVHTPGVAAIDPYDRSREIAEFNRGFGPQTANPPDTPETAAIPETRFLNLTARLLQLKSLLARMDGSAVMNFSYIGLDGTLYPTGSKPSDMKSQPDRDRFQAQLDHNTRNTEAITRMHAIRNDLLKEMDQLTRSLPEDRSRAMTGLISILQR